MSTDNTTNQEQKTALIHGDVLEELAKLPPGSVDCMLTDPPYGTTNAPWDHAPLWEPLFAQLWRVLKHTGRISHSRAKIQTATKIQ